jgi:hypothetical protein
MPIEAKSTLDAKALEASLPGLTQKLSELQKGLSDDEKAVFSSIVNSAALHLKSLQALSDSADIIFMKPISAVATVGVRQHLINLPQTLHLDK